MIALGAAKLVAVLSALGACLVYTAVLIAVGLFTAPRRVYRLESSGTQALRSGRVSHSPAAGRAVPVASAAVAPAAEPGAVVQAQGASSDRMGGAASAAAPRPQIIAQSSSPATVTSQRIEIRPEASAAADRIIIRPARKRKPIEIRPSEAPLWQDRGWRLVGHKLVGSYWTPYGTCAGTIKKARSARPEFFVHNPPLALRSHNHWSCFGYEGGGTYSVHFDPHPPFPDAGIVAVEKVLCEALASDRR